MSYNDPLSSQYQWNPDAFSNQMVADQILAGASQVDPFSSQGGASAPSSPTVQPDLPSAQTQDPYGNTYVDANGKAHYAPSPIGLPPYTYYHDANGQTIGVGPNPGAYAGGVPDGTQFGPNGQVSFMPGGQAAYNEATGTGTNKGPQTLFPTGPQGPGVYIPPRYFEGDQYQPASMSPDQVASLQQSMATAGYYGNTPNYVPGVWRSSDAAAYKDVLLAANQSGQDAGTIIRQEMDAQNNPAAVAARNRLIERQVYSTPIEVTSAADLTAAARRLAPDVIGRYLTPDEEKQFVGQFQNLQVQDQTKIRQSEVAAREGKLPDNAVVEKPPYRENSRTIEDIIRQQHPVEYGAAQIGEKGQMLLQLMSGQAGIPGHGEEKAG